MPLLGSSAIASKPKSSSDAATSTTSSASESETNGYDAVMCGENGYADGSGYSCTPSSDPISHLSSPSPLTQKKTNNRTIR